MGGKSRDNAAHDAAPPRRALRWLRVLILATGLVVSWIFVASAAQAAAFSADELEKLAAGEGVVRLQPMADGK